MAPSAGGLLNCLVRPRPVRLRQHQRPEHAGEEGQRGGGHRGGLGEGPLSDGRGGVPGWTLRPEDTPGVLQVEPLMEYTRLVHGIHEISSLTSH